MSHSTNTLGGRTVAKGSRSRALLKPMAALAVLATQAIVAGPSLAAPPMALNPASSGPFEAAFGPMPMAANPASPDRSQSPLAIIICRPASTRKSTRRS